MPTPTLADGATTSSSSSRCVPFAFRRGVVVVGGGGARGRRRLPAPGAGAHHAGPAPAVTGVGCGRPLCRAAGLVGGGIQGAFFASLDGCSCVEVRTKSFNKEHDQASAAAAPLIPPPPAHDDSDGTRSWAAAAGKGGGNKRRGLGCCTANTYH